MAPMLQSKLRHQEAYQEQGGRKTHWKNQTHAAMFNSPHTPEDPQPNLLSKQQ